MLTYSVTLRRLPDLAVVHAVFSLSQWPTTWLTRSDGTLTGQPEPEPIPGAAGFGSNGSPIRRGTDGLPCPPVTGDPRRWCDRPLPLLLAGLGQCSGANRAVKCRSCRGWDTMRMPGSRVARLATRVTASVT